MKKQPNFGLIVIGEYNWKNRFMTVQVFDTNKNLLTSKRISGGTQEIARFIAGSEAFRLLENSLDEDKEYETIYMTEWNSLRELRAANCVSGLYFDMFNFEEIITILEDSMDFLDALGLQFLKERSKMWDKVLYGDTKEFLN